jgi:hypothetical protein
MIRFSAIWVICAFALVSNAQESEKEDFAEHCHLEKRSLMLGAGVPYSIDHQMVGVNLRMYYNINHKLCFGPEYSYFRDSEREIVDFDFVGHYILEVPLVGIYPIVGANYTIEREVQKGETHAGVGLVWGAGTHRNFGKFTAFAEYSCIEFGIADQFVTAGLMYSIY